MYLIITHNKKDIAKVWQEKGEIEYQLLQNGYKQDIEEAIQAGFDLMKRWGQSIVQKPSDKPNMLIKRLAHAFKWYIVKIRGQDIEADCVDEKTGERWNVRLPIAKENIYTKEKYL